MIPITIDTREQTPFHFDEHLVKATIGTLKVGDYAITGDTGFAVERKNFDDFLGTISTGWARFQREIYRANERGFNLPIVVEGRLEDVLFHIDERSSVVPPAHDHFKLTPSFVLKRIGELYQIGASVFFAERPEYAVAIAYSMLHERWEVIQDDDADELPGKENHRKG